jgi:hypothetical protein
LIFAQSGNGRTAGEPDMQIREIQLHQRPYMLIGPCEYKNLALYLITGKETAEDIPFMTLQQALKRKLAIIKETGDVSNLTVTNNAKKAWLFIQAGEIVRGGKQDRTIRTDCIVPPGTENMPLQSFCVEKGRWSKRGHEEAEQFSSSANAAASREIRIAAKYNRSQQDVWSGVARLQGQLSENVGTPVQSEQSASSLELTLDHAEVDKRADAYVEVLEHIIDSRPVLGYVFAVNGRITTCDIYASEDLFTSLWPKLLRAAAVEAIAKEQKDQKDTAASLDDAAAFLNHQSDPESYRKEKINDIVTQIMREYKDRVFFETYLSKEDLWVHISIERIEADDRKPSPVFYPQQSIEHRPDLRQQRIPDNRR